jgi:hypothetical protein
LTEAPGSLAHLGRLVAELENEPALVEPGQLRLRLDALDRLDRFDRLDAYLPQAVLDADPIEPELYRRARAISARLEAVNRERYEAVRREIQRGSGPDALLRWVHILAAGGPAGGMGYDYLDELVSGVLPFEEPGVEDIPRDAEQVFYQPTPARHIFSLIGLAALTASDVLVDLGSGLGHVPLLVSISTPARCIGIELEPAYVERARQCAQSLNLNLNRVSFLNQDARVADLSTGTVFYLYTPFTGSILRAVLDRLRREAATRPLRICSYGPCTSVIAEEPWLEATTATEPDRIALFRSCN